MSDEQDIILADLSDEELTLQMHDDLYDGMKEEIEDGMNEINIEKIKKEFKTHRSAIDFDEKFINYCFQK